jgi:hypothetical protein
VAGDVIREEMFFMPRKVWLEGEEVRVVIKNETHRVVSPLRLVHGRYEPAGNSLVTENVASGQQHSWAAIPFPSQK